MKQDRDIFDEAALVAAVLGGEREAFNSTSGSFFQGQWLLVIGLGEGEWREELKRRRDQLMYEFEALLPPLAHSGSVKEQVHED